jgi:type I restriction enzyme, S subunit
MSKWKEYKFSDVLIDESISYGIVQPGTHTETDSVPIIRVNNIRNGGLKIDDVLKVSSAIEQKYKRTRLRGGELLITVVGTVGECAIVPSHLMGWNVARAISVARIKKDFDKRFIRYCFKSEDLKFQMYGNTNDTVQPTLNLSLLKELVLTIPPLPEQKAIAQILSSLDDKIDLLHRQNKTLEAIAETLFRQWFIEEVKDDWREGTLADISDNIRDAVKPADIQESTIYVGLEHIDRRDITLKQCGLGEDVNSNKYAFKSQDVLFGKLRPYFHKVCFTPFSGICSTDILVIRPKEEKWFPFCLFSFFQDDVVEFANLGSGGTRMPRTSWQNLKSYPINIPDTENLTRFNQLVLPSIEKMTYNLKQMQTLEQIRDTLLPKLMSGEIRIAIDPDIKAA